MKKELNYTTLSQNDKEGIEYVRKDYDSEPAKGLIHGLQKDAIQNSVGASLTKKFKGWRITFELTKIRGKDALIFVDEGTTGLIGDILTQDEIMSRKAANTLRDNDHLSRFRTVFNSGGNQGPGSYGRGKLVFQACSKTYTILCDSLRSNDHSYISFKRTINQLQLQESDIFEGNRAKELLKEQTDDKLKPLKVPGTRIVIMDLDPGIQSNNLSIKDSFIRSFDKDSRDDECELSFDKMIAETWWELILKYGLQIVLRFDGNEKTVELTDPIKSIVEKRNSDDGWRVYDKHNIGFDFNGEEFKIKQIRFVVSPKGQTLPETFQSISTQRKGMKVGSISKGIAIHPQIKKNFTGFVTLEESLEELLLPPENMTHYGYSNLRSSVIKRLRAEVELQLTKFQKELGLSSESGNGHLSKLLNDALKEVNEQAKELGLLAASGLGKRKKNFKISVIDIPLPRPGKFRVEYEDEIGPVKLTVENMMRRNFTGQVKVILSQDNNPHTQVLYDTNLVLQRESVTPITLPPFRIDRLFHYGSRILFKIEIVNENSSNSRFFWLGIEPELRPRDILLVLKNLNIEFPRKDTCRVEIGERISNLDFSIESHSPLKLEAKISVNVRLSLADDNRVLKNLVNDIVAIEPLAEIECVVPDIEISSQIFEFLDDSEKYPPLSVNRRCRVEISAVASRDYPENGIVQGQHLMRHKKIDFYVGVDEPGMSIFKNVTETTDDPYKRRSYYEQHPDGDGYTFVLFSKHPFFEKVRNIYPELQAEYIKEEMLKSAYNICIKEDALSGVFTEQCYLGDSFATNLVDDLDKTELLKVHENLMSRALYKMHSE